MGQKVNPVGLRLGITRTWDSIWFSKEDYSKNLHEDIKIREFLQKKFKNSALVRVVIERFPEKINVNLHTAKPGVVIGQKGQNIENVKNLIKKFSDKPINLNIVEVKKPEVKKPNVINIMDEDNDNDQTPNNNKKDKRPLRSKPNTEATHHDISIIKQLKLF